MRIAITSQNLKSVTAHAGKCRRFWIYETDSGTLPERRFVEIPIEETFHFSHGGLASALDGIDVLITASMGGGLRAHLQRRGIVPFVTREENPDVAVVAYLNGNLAASSAADHECDDHARQSTGRLE